MAIFHGYVSAQLDYQRVRVHSLKTFVQGLKAVKSLDMSFDIQRALDEWLKHIDTINPPNYLTIAHIQSYSGFFEHLGTQKFIHWTGRG
jgi:hypothetical protein